MNLNVYTHRDLIAYEGDVITAAISNVDAGGIRRRGGEPIYYFITAVITDTCLTTTMHTRTVTSSRLRAIS